MVKDYLFKVRASFIVKYGLMLAFISVGFFLIYMNENLLSDNTKPINFFWLIFALIVLAFYFVLQYYVQMKKIICAEDMEGCQQIIEYFKSVGLIFEITKHNIHWYVSEKYKIMFPVGYFSDNYYKSFVGNQLYKENNYYRLLHRNGDWGQKVPSENVFPTPEEAVKYLEKIK